MWREKNEHRWYGDLENFRKNFTQKKNDVTAKDSFSEIRESSLFSVHFQIAEMFLLVVCAYTPGDIKGRFHVEVIWLTYSTQYFDS